MDRSLTSLTVLASLPCAFASTAWSAPVADAPTIAVQLPQ